MMANKMTAVWIILTIIGLIILIWNIAEYQDAANDVKIAEQKMWEAGKELGMSDAQIQAEIDAAKARAD